MTLNMTFAATAAMLAVTINPAFAQQGTTLAGPAQGSKADGSSSMTPSAASGANGGSMSPGVGSTSTDAGTAAGTMGGGSATTSVPVGGAAGRN